MIRKALRGDLPAIHEIINDAASAYKGVIPASFTRGEYMTEKYLKDELRSGVKFFCYTRRGRPLGVMGIQDVRDVTLIRHAYVRTSARRQGIGGKLLKYLLGRAKKPVLIGTWRAAKWAVDFYKGYGFTVIEGAGKNRLLKKYWDISKKHMDSSVVLAGREWMQNN